MGSPHLKRKSAAALNARQLTTENKADIGENLSPNTVQIDILAQVKYPCVDFGGRLKIASLKS